MLRNDKKGNQAYVDYVDATDLVWAAIMSQNMDSEGKHAVSYETRLQNYNGLLMGNRVYRRIVERYNGS